jgi:hypothetical protein
LADTTVAAMDKLYYFVCMTDKWLSEKHAELDQWDEMDTGLQAPATSKHRSHLQKQSGDTDRENHSRANRMALQLGPRSTPTSPTATTATTKGNAAAAATATGTATSIRTTTFTGTTTAHTGLSFWGFNFLSLGRAHRITLVY